MTARLGRIRDVWDEPVPCTACDAPIESHDDAGVPTNVWLADGDVPHCSAVCVGIDPQ